MKIKILGPGCMKCEKLQKEITEALAELGVTADMEKVTDMIKSWSMIL
jgi:hypothetical protein